MKNVNYLMLCLGIFCFFDLSSAYNFYYQEINKNGCKIDKKHYSNIQKHEIIKAYQLINNLHIASCREKLISHAENLSKDVSYPMLMGFFAKLFNAGYYDVARYLIPVISKNRPKINVKLMSYALNNFDLNGYKAALGPVTAFPMRLKGDLNECIKKYDPAIHHEGVCQLMQKYRKQLFISPFRSNNYTCLIPQRLPLQVIKEGIKRELKLMKKEPNNCCYVFEVNGAVAGFILYRLSSKTFSGKRCEIRLLAVTEEFCRNNVATALLQRVIEITKKDGIQNIFVDPALHNIASQRLYLKNGFDYTSLPLFGRSTIHMEYINS